MIRCFMYITGLFFTTTTYSVVILIHGTFAGNAVWYKPGGDFFEPLRESAAERRHDIKVISWSGSLLPEERIRAAEKLVFFLLEAIESDEKAEIITIGHSHGGNIINLASQLLQPYESAPPFSRFVDVTCFLEAHRRLRVVRERLALLRAGHVIERAYLLGTPIDTTAYAPNMSVIHHLVNCWSLGDTIQPLLGFSRTITGIEGVVNIEIRINDVSPNHHQVHSPLVAEKLLAIPFELQEEGIGGFEEFSWDHDGVISFSDDEEPLYSQKEPCERLAKPRPLGELQLPGWL